MKEKKHVKIYGGLREDFGMKTYLHSSKDYAKKMKLRFRFGGLNPPEKEEIYQYL